MGCCILPMKFFKKFSRQVQFYTFSSKNGNDWLDTFELSLVERPVKTQSDKCGTLLPRLEENDTLHWSSMLDTFQLIIQMYKKDRINLNSHINFHYSFAEHVFYNLSIKNKKNWLLSRKDKYVLFCRLI